MELRRTLLVAVGAALSLLAGVPAAMTPATAAPAPQVQAASVLPDFDEVPPPAPPDAPRGATVTVPTTFFHDGQNREFVLHVPQGLLAPAPLVVALHAHSQEPKHIRAYSRLEQLADEEGFVVAFPEGAAGSWNAGLCCFPGSTKKVDDIAYLDEVIALAQKLAPIDAARINLTGGSNGAMMALRYACERPQLVASVAVVSGPLVAPCPLKEPVPVLFVQGGKDTVVPLNGGRNKFLGVTFPALVPSLEPFRKAGGDVKVLVIPRAGHEWMTRAKHGFDATRGLWTFMRDHPRTARPSA